MANEEQPSQEDRWQEFHEITETAPPHPLLVEATKLTTGKGIALDLGAGSLRDAKFLAEEGFELVEAVDQSEHILELGKHLPNLQAIVSEFESFSFPANRYELINAHYSLPFNSPHTFEDVFNRLKSSLSINGVFVGQLFGINDGRSFSSRMTFHTKREAEELLADLEVLHLDELEFDGQLANGDPHHWHQFNIVARRQK